MEDFEDNDFEEEEEEDDTFECSECGAVVMGNEAACPSCHASFMEEEEEEEFEDDEEETEEEEEDSGRREVQGSYGGPYKLYVLGPSGYECEEDESGGISRCGSCRREMAEVEVDKGYVTLISQFRCSHCYRPPKTDAEKRAAQTAIEAIKRRWGDRVQQRPDSDDDDDEPIWKKYP